MTKLKKTAMSKDEVLSLEKTGYSYIQRTSLADEILKFLMQEEHDAIEVTDIPDWKKDRSKFITRKASINKTIKKRNFKCRLVETIDHKLYLVKED